MEEQSTNQPKRGRRPIDPADRRSIHVAITLNESELSACKSEMVRNNIKSISAFFRILLQHHIAMVNIGKEIGNVIQHIADKAENNPVQEEQERTELPTRIIINVLPGNEDEDEDENEQDPTYVPYDKFVNEQE